MTISCLQGGQAIAQLSEGKKTNLEIQKLLYFACMFYIGENGIEKSLIDRDFSTWRYGPAVRHLYDHIKGYGNGLVPVKAFDDIKSIIKKGTEGTETPEAEAGFETEFDVIKRTYDRFKKYPAYKLVAISHWEGGAWTVTKEEGKEIITNTAIWNEYNGRYKT